MRKYRFASLLLCAFLLISCTAVAEQTAIAPEVVAGKIMGYVINNDGAAVYENIYAEGASMEPVETIAYGTEVEIQTLGLGYCRLHRENKEFFYVRTKDLSFSNEPFTNQIAIVFVKRSNKLPLHRTASTKSGHAADVPDGSYVVVLEKGDTFSHVLYKKYGGKVYEGDLQNAYLSFRETWTDDVFQAVLHDPAKPKRKTSINMRSSNSAKGKKVSVIPTYDKARKGSTILTVLQIKDDWAEVETEKGLHGYIKASWVEATQPAPVEETEAAAAEETEAAVEETETTAAEEAETAAEEADIEETATEDIELLEGADMDETSLSDDEDVPAEAEDVALAPEWEEDAGE